MARPPVGPEMFRRRLVGLYALTLMEREGPIHGYGLSERIAERTEGAWRPGPGSVYPSLRKLVEVGLARTSPRGLRRLYTITPAGRGLLARVRRGAGEASRPRPDLSALWAEVFGAETVEALRLHRLRRSLEVLEAQIGRAAERRDDVGSLRSVVLAELAASSKRIRAIPGGRRTTAGRSAGGD